MKTLDRRRTAIVALMFSLSVMSYFDRTIMSIAGPGIMKEFGISEVEMGSVYSAFLLSYALLMIPGGWLSDRFGPRRVLAWSALGSAVCTALMGLGGRPGLGTWIGIIPSFVLVRLGLGVFTAPLYPTCGRANANWMPQHLRASVQGYVNAGAGLGGAISPLLFAWMMGRYGWRLSFCFAGAATALLGGLWYASVRDHPPDAPKPEPHRSTPWRALFTDRNIILLTVGYFAIDYFEYIFFYWIFYYLGEIRKLGASESAFYTTILFLTWLVMTPMGGWAADRASAALGRKRGLRLVGVAGLLIASLLLVVGARASNTVTAVACMSLALGFASCSDVTFWAGVIDVGGKHAGAAGGILNSGGNIGGFLAPILTPWIASHWDWTAGLFFGSLMALVGVVTWLFTDPTRRLASD